MRLAQTKEERNTVIGTATTSERTSAEETPVVSISVSELRSSVSRGSCDNKSESSKHINKHFSGNSDRNSNKNSSKTSSKSIGRNISRESSSSSSSKNNKVHTLEYSQKGRPSGFKMFARRLSFSKHSLPKQYEEKHSNLSQSIADVRQQTAKAPKITVDTHVGAEEGSGSACPCDEDEAPADEKSMGKEEDRSEYKKGGYHPVFIGERYGVFGQYEIVRKLGWGHFSTVWLAWDGSGKRHVAIKVVKSAKNYREAAEDEIKILEKVNSGPADHPGKSHVVQLLDHFIHKGPNGSHICMVFEVLGENMVSLLTRYKSFQDHKTQEIQRKSLGDASTPPSETSGSGSDAGAGSSTESLQFHMSQLNDLTILHESYGGLPVTLVKQISKQILLGLDYLHRYCGIIHTDLKPENVLVEIKDVEALVEALRVDRGVHTGGMHSTGVRSGFEHPGLVHRRAQSTATTPVRISKPLATPVETSSSVENFFRSFSVHRAYSSTSEAGGTGGTRRRPTTGSTIVPTKAPGEVYVDARETPSPGAPSTGGDPAHNESTNNLTSNNANNESTNFSNNDANNETSNNVGNSETTNNVGNSETTNNVGNSETTNNVGNSETTSNSGNSETTNNFSNNLANNDSTNINTCFSRAASSSSSPSILNDLSSVISVKIADLGNACWFDTHFYRQIQTRPYRAPEVIMGGQWGCSADLWSCGCLIFELITGDYLFDPQRGASFDKNDDHLAQMIELLGKWPPKDFLRRCKYSRHFFDKTYQSLRHIGKLKVWTLPEILHEEYFLEMPLARCVADFLLSMLNYEPQKRVDAGSMSNHPWLADTMAGNSIDRPFGLTGQDIRGYSCEYRAKRRESSESVPSQDSGSTDSASH
ncbi:DEBR0S2_02190g1_1 [Brettanomyces bruxellensis]|uniref:non-specific serine/threonine protein kinase n=1 Tax=Dekkera bruxellensis TaxID=5007 RepID=A0A7D9H0E6_DEKBR|nr:DEBR0S2_02190g1_1 [Brettanomyces bruxellensis]